MEVENSIGLGLSRLQSKFLSMKTNDVLTDASIVCHSVVIKAHKCILSVNSSYFKSVFTKYLHENVQVDCSEQTSDVEQFGSIIDFMYTGNILVSEDNIGDLVGLGAFFGIDDLVYICVKYIGQSLNQCNCLKIYLNLHNARLNCEGPITLSSLSSEVNLVTKVWKMLEGGFHDYIIHQEQVLQISTEDMEHLLQKDITKHCSVDGLLNLADRWLQAHPDNDGVQVIQKLLPLAVEKAENLMFASKDSIEIITCRDNIAAMLSQVSSDTQLTELILSHLYTILDLRDKNILIGDSVYTNFLTGNETFDEVPAAVDTNLANGDATVYSLSEFSEMTDPPTMDTAVISEATDAISNEMEATDVTLVNEENVSAMFYQCSVCYRLFQKKSYLESHMMEHRGDTEVQCTKCFQKFEYSRKLETHVCPAYDWSLEGVQADKSTIIDVFTKSASPRKKSASMERPYACSICTKSFKRKDHLNIHTRCHTGERPYPCMVCDARFRMRKALNMHMLKHTYQIGATLGCEICNITCGSSQLTEMALHMREHMTTVKKVRTWKCQECGVTFHRKILLKAHMAKHSAARHICVWCKRQFQNRIDLIAHRKVCTSDRVFSCDHCNKKFQVHAILKKHIAQVHDMERKFTCHLCNKSFADKYNLNRHSTIHTEELPYKCKTCEKSFKHNTGLIRHARIDHMEGKKFKCEKCHMVFSDGYDLKRHNKIHTGDTPYKCDICEDAKFTKSTALKLHFRRIHDITDMEAENLEQGNFKCEQCNEDFHCKSLQIKHIKDTHESKVHRKSRKSQPCGLCDKVFTDQNDLILHVQMHVFDSPYNCEICGKPFKDEIKMKRHLDSHSDRMIGCLLCKAIYTSKSGIDAHVRKVHPEAARPVKDLVHRCAECGVKFEDNKDLLAHIRTHFAVASKPTETGPGNSEAGNSADVEQKLLLNETVSGVGENLSDVANTSSSNVKSGNTATRLVNGTGENVLLKTRKKRTKGLIKLSKKDSSDTRKKLHVQLGKQLHVGRKPKKITENVRNWSGKKTADLENVSMETKENPNKKSSRGRLGKKPEKLSENLVHLSNKVPETSVKSKKGTMTCDKLKLGSEDINKAAVVSETHVCVESKLDEGTTLRRLSSRKRMKKHYCTLIPLNCHEMAIKMP